jgi:hypothetical protein
MNDEERNGTHWSRTPVCSCTGEGKTMLFEGEIVVFRSPSCRVHSMTLSPTQAPRSVERLIGNWMDTERIV